MADGEKDAGVTTFCTNCKRDIPQVNYVMHHNHCHRNIVLCSQCQEPVPRTEMDEHNEEYHVKVTCKCGEAIEKCKQEEHDAEECSQRQVHCEYCEMEMYFKDLSEHKDFCGSRTDLCPLCQRFIFFRDKAHHEDTNCRYPEIKPTKPSTAEPSFHQRERNEFFFGSSPPERRILDPFFMPPARPMGVSMGDRKGGVPTAMRRSMSDGLSSVARKDWKNQDRVQNAMPKSPVRPKEKNEMRSILQPSMSQQDLDRRLAETLAHDPPPYYSSSRQADLSDDESYPGNRLLPYQRYPGEDDLAVQQMIKDTCSIPAVNFQEHNPALAGITIPCEFCQQPIPAETLIQHQSGCRPDITSHPATDAAGSNNNRPRGTSLTNPAPSEIRNNLHGAALPGYVPTRRDDSPPPYDDDNLSMIPCEFCEELLPADSLPMHQVNCEENRTVTPLPETSDPSPGSYSWRTARMVDTPNRPTPLQHVPPQQGLTARSKPSKYQGSPSLLDPSVDDDDISDDNETFLTWPAKPEPPAQSKSRQARNPFAQPPFHKPPCSRSSVPDKYLPNEALYMPNASHVGKPKTQNTAPTKRPQSKSNARVQETLIGLNDAPPSPPNEEELNNSTQARYVAGQLQQRVPKVPKNNESFNKPKKINLEADVRPTFTSKSNPASYRGKPPGQRTAGPRQKGSNPSHTKRYAQGDVYRPSIPGKDNQRRGQEPLAKRENALEVRAVKPPYATAPLTFDPDDQTRLPQTKDDANPYRTANQKPVQRRRANGPPKPRNYHDDAAL